MQNKKSIFKKFNIYFEVHTSDQTYNPSMDDLTEGFLLVLLPVVILLVGGMR